MLGRTDSRRRLLFLLGFFIFGSLALTARLAYWQVFDRDRLNSEALAQTTVTLDTPSKRGEIFDRTGTVMLATTVQRERLVAAPSQLTPDSRRATTAALAEILGLDEPARLALRDRLNGNARYVIIQHGLDRDVADEIRAAIDTKRVSGLSLEPEPERRRPRTCLGRGAAGRTRARTLASPRLRPNRPLRLPVSGASLASQGEIPSTSAAASRKNTWRCSEPVSIRRVTPRASAIKPFSNPL